MIIAVDGPAAAGKGTLAHALAEHYDYSFLDTGSLYRAVAQSVLAKGGNPSDEAAAIREAQTLDLSKIKEHLLRTPEVGSAASIVAVMPAVRAAILNFQRQFAYHPPQGKKGAVLDGRDIGTVVCPDADVKFFVTARAEIRAHRRWLELKGSGSQASEAQVLEEVKERDRRDMERAASPLRPAPDAHLLDTSDLSIEAAFDAAVAIIGKVQR